MINEHFYLFTFRSTHSAMEAQKLLKNCRPIIMPTLRSISSTCGISIRIEESFLQQAKSLIEAEPGMSGMVVLYQIERIEKVDIPTLVTEF